MNKAGQPDAPVDTQTMWRPVSNPTTSVPVAPTIVHKPKRQRRGRTDAQMLDDETDPRYIISRRHIWQVEPCPCTSECSCPSDGRLTYKRDDKYDSTAVKGTRSTYCYKFDKRALHLSVRQFSCYCRWCVRCQYTKCTNLDVVRHEPKNVVRPMESGYRSWRDTGWRQIQLQKRSAPDPAVTRASDQSLESACEFVTKLPIGSTIAIMTKTEDNPTFWFASKQSEIKIAQKTDKDTGIKRGEKILSIIWYDRLSDYKYIKLDDVNHVSVSSVIVTTSKVAWQRTTTNRYYLGEHTHSLLQNLVNKLSEL